MCFYGLVENNFIVQCHFLAHTPDNTFIGFVIEKREFSKENQQNKKKNITVVYGKQDKFWAVSFL